MRSNLLIACALGLFVLSLAFFIGCTKNTSPQPPVHDTVTVIKNDTTTKTDTLYATKPDSTVNLTKGLMLYLPFSGNIADSSGNGNLAQAVGSVLTYDAHGYANNAFGSDGSGSEYILVTNNGSIQFDTAYSLSFDFMINAAKFQTFMGFVNFSDGEGPTFSLGTTLPSLPYFDMGAIGGGDTVCNQTSLNNPTRLVDTTSFIPVPTSWYNMVATYNKGTLNIYENGQLIESKSVVSPLAAFCTESQFVVGAWWQGDLESMNGKLDNIRLYNRVLTPHEIATLSSNYQVTSNSIKAAPKYH